jgi:AcrR family transcriptional regulator
MAIQAEQLPRLPRGRHRLSREQVSESQRSRMLIAICEEMAERGYVETSVAAVIARAGFSRETLYEHLDNKID